MTKSRTHKVVVSVTFNKPIGKADATAAVRDCIHGEFYPYIPGENTPDEFKIRSVRAHRAPKR